jgi:NAD(P)-dependent dehydrogenase (short-subunit alcohol dehydrogenase family)
MRVFITGSAEGLGQMVAERIAAVGHEVVLHARSQSRARQALEATPGAADALVADLASLHETKELAETANTAGRFDAVIHNAGVGFHEPLRRTEDGLPHVLAINALAPYVLTSLMSRPDRLVYLTSGMHRGGEADLSDLTWKRRGWNGAQAYSDSKLFDLILAFAVARHWPEVLANAVEPGWVATKMGRALPTTSPPGQRRRPGLQSARTPKRWSQDACFTTAARTRTILSRTMRISKTNSSDNPPSSRAYRFRQAERRRYLSAITSAPPPRSRR